MIVKSSIIAITLVLTISLIFGPQHLQNNTDMIATGQIHYSGKRQLQSLQLKTKPHIWFVEKDDTLATRLYSLPDFKIRKDLEIRKHYLQGRFGAVPFLADLDRLMAGQTGAA